jgi:hypothetical protein
MNCEQCLWVSFLKNPHETPLVLYGNPKGLKGLLHMLNATVHPTKAGFIFDVFHFTFLLCIAKGLAICKFGGVISAEYCTFTPFNLHMLSS